jgi:hypothetical protein
MYPYLLSPPPNHSRTTRDLPWAGTTIAVDIDRLAGRDSWRANTTITVDTDRSASRDLWRATIAIAVDFDRPVSLGWYGGICRYGRIRRTRKDRRILRTRRARGYCRTLLCLGRAWIAVNGVVEEHGHSIECEYKENYVGTYTVE